MRPPKEGEKYFPLIKVEKINGKSPEAVRATEPNIRRPSSRPRSTRWLREAIPTMSMTDLHIYAPRDGYRDTDWERDGKEHGWGNNRGLVLRKSWDLIHWKRTNLRFDKLSAVFSEIGCAWARCV